MARTQGSPETYSLTIDMNALNHLGISLYSNVPAVLSEVIANAWDADAENVNIQIDLVKKEIEITDDGIGMSISDANKKYLTVGYRKRDHGETVTLEHNRKVMGRKGIGKLSLFSIARIIEVTSVKKDGSKAGFILSTEKIEEHIKAGTNLPYHPDPIDEETITHTRGTKIVLKELKKDLSKVETYLRTRLARRFSVIEPGNQFAVSINGVEITAEDRDYLKHLQYVWVIGQDKKPFSSLCPAATKIECIDGDLKLPGGGTGTVRGWVGTFKRQDQVKEGFNTIAINARGKLIDEDILRYLKEGGIFTKYISGILDAEFLDTDSEDDVATSDRQSIKEDDPRFETLKDFVQENILKTLQKDWSKFRREEALVSALQNPAVSEWFNSLGSDRREYAKKLFSMIESFPLEDQSAKKELYRHGILAFEKLAAKDMLSRITDLNDWRDVEAIKKVFSGIDEIEAVEYYGIAKGRLAVIKKFEELTDAKVKERILQEHIFSHLWLLDASWERPTTDARMEQQVTTEFGKIPLTKEEKKGRIDIRYRSIAGKHVIIELKKYTVDTDVHDLSKQVTKYQSALKKCLNLKYPNKAHEIETICILGNPPTPKDNPEQNKDVLAAIHARFITYDELIQYARHRYADYIDSQEKTGRLFELIERI